MLPLIFTNCHSLGTVQGDVDGMEGGAGGLVGKCVFASGARVCQDPASLLSTATWFEAHVKPPSSFPLFLPLRFFLIPQLASWNMLIQLIHLQC